MASPRQAAIQDARSLDAMLAMSASAPTVAVGTVPVAVKTVPGGGGAAAVVPSSSAASTAKATAGSLIDGQALSGELIGEVIRGVRKLRSCGAPAPLVAVIVQTEPGSDELPVAAAAQLRSKLKVAEAVRARRLSPLPRRAQLGANGGIDALPSPSRLDSRARPWTRDATVTPYALHHTTSLTRFPSPTVTLRHVILFSIT